MSRAADRRAIVALTVVLATGGPGHTARASTPSTAQVAIAHDGIGCAVANRFVQIEASLTPPGSVARARILFRGGTEHWYFTPLTEDKSRAGRFIGHIPKPLETLKSFEYYVSATDAAFGEARTSDRRVTVVPRNVACPTGTLAGSAGSLAARLVVSALSGGAPLPTGFAASGLIAGASAGAATAASGGGGAAATGAGAAGGGISGTALAVVGGLAAAGGVAVAAGGGSGSGGTSGGGSTGGGGGSTPTPTPGASPAPSPGSSPQPSPGPVNVFVVTIPSPFINVSNCSGQSTTFGGWNITTAAPDGTFSEVHSIMTPVLRVTGQITATSLNASLSCVNGAGTGNMSASGSNFSLSGTFTFNGRTGPFSVARIQ